MMGSLRRRLASTVALGAPAAVAGRGTHPTRTVLLLLFCSVLTAVEMHFIATKLGMAAFIASVKASDGVVNGLPHWRIYQSRVLGPYTADLVARSFAISLPAAQAIYGAACLLLAKSAILFHRRRDGSAGPALFMLLTGSLLFALLTNKPWLYAWDFFGILAFTLFVIFAIEKRPWTWFVPLVLVTFLNKESAAFISAWMVMQAVLGRAGGGRPLAETVDWRMLAAGLVTAACGLFAVHLLRETLLVREVGPELFSVSPARTDWFHWNLPKNLKVLGAVLTVRYLSQPWLFFLLSLGGMVAASLLAVRRFPRHTALCLSFLLLLVAVFMFGIVRESRVMMEVIPFFSVFLPHLACGGDRGGTA